MNWSDLQLRFDFELDEATDDAEERSISAEEARQISAAARQTFEDGTKPTWIEDYLKLRELGWPWRVASYIAWASSPKRGRWPGSLAELADKVLGLKSPRVVYTWREKYPAIDATVAMMQVKELQESKRDVVHALIESASDPDYKAHNDRKLFLEMVGLHIPKSKLELADGRARDLSELSDEELDQLMGKEQKIHREDAKGVKDSLSKEEEGEEGEEGD